MKRSFFFILFAALLGVATVRAENLASIFTKADMRPVPERRTSIIYIQCHGLGCGDLSCYGQTNYQTPNLDKLAAEGIRFTNFHPGGTNFTEALAALMSGNNSRSVPNGITVAERLKQAGYHTGLIGEWTLGAKPWTQGFDEFAGFLNDSEGRNYYSDFLWRFAPHSIFNATNKTFTDYIGKEVIYQNEGGKKGRYMPSLLIKAMCNFLSVNKPDLFNHYRPFFLLVNLPAPRSARPNAADFPVPTDAPFSDEPWPQAARNRAALITRLDGGIGRLFEQMNKLRLTNNVAIFFSSSAAPEKFKGKSLDFLKLNGKFTSKEDSARPPLPMIVWWPGEIPAKQVSDFRWTSADFEPTALAIAYAKPVKKLDGVSILPELRGQTQTNHVEAAH